MRFVHGSKFPEVWWGLGERTCSIVCFSLHVREYHLTGTYLVSLIHGRTWLSETGSIEAGQILILNVAGSDDKEAFGLWSKRSPERKLSQQSTKAHLRLKTKIVEMTFSFCC